MITTPQLAGNIATYGAAPEAAPAMSPIPTMDSAAANTVLSTPTDSGSATALTDPQAGTDFSPAGIFDAPALMNTSLMDSSLGVDMNSLMMLDAQLNATMAQAFTVTPITVFPDPMLSGATAFGTPMFDPATNGTQTGVAAYGNAMSQIASYTAAAAQVGMNTAVYSAQMQGATAVTQAQGQATMDYMNMMA